MPLTLPCSKFPADTLEIKPYGVDSDLVCFGVWNHGVRTSVYLSPDDQEILVDELGRLRLARAKRDASIRFGTRAARQDRRRAFANHFSSGG